MTTYLTEWRQANPSIDYCTNCRVFGHVALFAQQAPGMVPGTLKLCYLCAQVPEAQVPANRGLFQALSLILNELVPPKKPRAPRQAKGKLSVIPMTPRGRR